MDRPSISEYYKDMLALVAARSTCLRRRVGAIVTDDRHVVLGLGYNGVPREIPHCGDGITEAQKRWRRDRGFAVPTDPLCRGAGDQPGDSSRCWATHAEQNALLQCGDVDRARFIYVSATPCFTCAKMIANTKIERVCCVEPYADLLGLEVLRLRGIVVATWSDEQRDFTYRP